MSRCCAKQAACCHGAAILDKRRHQAVRCGNFGNAMELALANETDDIPRRAHGFGGDGAGAV
ncbi:MAG TPA: hypothetical protein VK554_04690, partial [Bradyrhizobium sp.]|nr:hypothetical protein [Bradyrhizobium sp.]